MKKIEEKESLPNENCLCWIYYKGKIHLADFYKGRSKPFFEIIKDKGGYPLIDWNQVEYYQVIEQPVDMAAGKEIFNIQYKVRHRLNNGPYRETQIVNIAVPADTAEQAYDKLNLFVRDNVDAVIVSVNK